MKMISPAEFYKRYRSKLCSLSTLSKGGIEGKVFVTSPLRALNFDKIKNEYVGSLNLKEVKSNDAFFYDQTRESWVFIEFKNEKLNLRQRHDLRKKIYDSIFVLSDLAQVNLAQIREHTHYILVYSEAKNKDDSSSFEHEAKNKDGSSSFEQIATEISNMAKIDLIDFGLGFFLNYCFSRMETVTKDEFEEKVLPTLSFYSLD